MTFTEFLLARIAEDEATARDAHYDGQDAAHIVKWSPARVLAECEAKRRIVEEFRRADIDGSGDYELGYGLTVAIEHLAAVYADHPDYRA